MLGVAIGSGFGGVFPDFASVWYDFASFWYLAFDLFGIGLHWKWFGFKSMAAPVAKARPTFYVLVHQDTVEERMSRHRTRSVLGVEYERVTGDELVTSQSVLGGLALYGTVRS